MLQHPAAVRAAFEEAARSFLSTVRAVPADAWDAPAALGSWTTRELVAHTLRAFTTIETYLASEPKIDRVLADAGEYYRASLAESSVHEGIAQRGRDGGAALDDPLGESEATTERVLALVASTLDDDPVNTFAGSIVFSEYLATRTVEVAVHTLDLQRAIGEPAELHPATGPIVLQVVTDLVDPAVVLLALTGRRPLPEHFNALG